MKKFFLLMLTISFFIISHNICCMKRQYPGKSKQSHRKRRKTILQSWLEMNHYEKNKKTINLEDQDYLRLSNELEHEYEQSNLWKIIDNGEITKLINKIKNGANLKLLGLLDETVIHHAASFTTTKNIYKYKILELLCSLAKYGQVKFDNGEIVKYYDFLDINAKDIHDMTALQLAVSNENLEAVKILCKYDAHVNLTYKKDFTTLKKDLKTLPVAIALRKKNIDIVEYLTSKGAKGIHQIHAACHKGKIELIKNLLSKQGEKKLLNIQDAFTHYSPLHFAVSGGQEETVKLLIANSANHSLQNIFGRKPIDIAEKLRGFNAKRIPNSHQKIFDFLAYLK